MSDELWSVDFPILIYSMLLKQKLMRTLRSYWCVNCYTARYSLLFTSLFKFSYWIQLIRNETVQNTTTGYPIHCTWVLPNYGMTTCHYRVHILYSNIPSHQNFASCCWTVTCPSPLLENQLFNAKSHQWSDQPLPDDMRPCQYICIIYSRKYISTWLTLCLWPLNSMIVVLVLLWIG